MAITNLSNRKFTVYAIQCTKNGKLYVGCSCSFDTRIKTHFAELADGRKDYCDGRNSRVKSSWQIDYDNYGRDAFKVYILEDGVSYNDKSERENYWIEYYGSFKPEYGYNIKHRPVFVPVKVEPGMPERKLSDERKAQMAANLPWNKQERADKTP